MKRTEWFNRTFPPIADNGLLPGIIERIEGTPARLRYKLANRDGEIINKLHEGKWTIKKEVVHLIILEDLWKTRIKQFAEDTEELHPADLTNRATHESELDQLPLRHLLDLFENDRKDLVVQLRALDEASLLHSSLHPRLKQPMRAIDMANFVAEHDDHHLAQITALLAE
ncbi:hypothetical protein BH09BAC6_BH09BAC6_36420 [soil metagenome]|jgi:uncharacterized damage-inducible protein DinB